MIRILLVRHGEALKNLTDRRGGPGTPLTDKGRRQVAQVPEQVRQLTADRPDVVYYCERAQVEESARIVSEAWGTPMVVDGRIEPLYLGILDGLSRVAALERDRATASALNAWRSGYGSLEDLSIPAAESFAGFLARAQEFLQECREERADQLVCTVGTRSILIMLKNILLGDPDAFPRGYKMYDIPHGLEGLYVVGGSAGRASAARRNQRS